MFGYNKKSMYLCTRNNYQEYNEKDSTNFSLYLGGLNSFCPKRKTIQYRQQAVK